MRLRNTLITTLLALMALLSVTAAVFLTVDGSLARLTGWYHFRSGMSLFPAENMRRLSEVQWIRIQDLHDSMECIRKEDGTWWIVHPFRDRMSPSAVQLILSFTAQAKLVDTLPLNHTTRASLREFGVETSPHTITLKVANGDDLSTIARYTLGSASPWLADAEDGEHVLPTTYLRTDFYGRDKRIHVVRGNILSIFKNGLEGLRDPHVLNYEQDDLLALSIQRKGEKEILISRQTAETPWAIFSPTICDANQDNVDALLSQLSRIKAVRIDEADAVQLPEEAEMTLTFTVANREPVRLTLYPAFTSPSDGQRLCYAKVEDRPVVFTLAVEPRLRRKGSYAELVNNVLSLPVLPPAMIARIQSANDAVYVDDLTFNLKELRSTRLSNIEGKDIDKVHLRSRYAAQPVKLLRIPGDTEGQVGDVWMVSAAGQRYQEADPNVVADFLNSLSNVPVADFEWDFAPGDDVTDKIKEYGLNSPDYILLLQPRECAARAVLFGVDMPLVKDRSPRTFYFRRIRSAGQPPYWVAMEQNMHSIYRLSSRMTKLFAFTPEAWKKRNMVQFPISALRTLTLYYQQAELVLHYDYIDGSWTGTLNGEDITPRINPHRTDYYVRHLQRIRVDQWLGKDDETALASLQKPAFSVSLDLEETNYSSTESVTVSQKDDAPTPDTVQQMLTEKDQTDEIFRMIALGDKKVEKRRITIDIAPAPVRMQRPYFYGRIRESGDIFILSYDNAQGLDGNLLD